MSYNYEDLRPKIFTEEMQVLFLTIRDHISELIYKAGACTLEKALEVDLCEGNFEKMACVDRLVELGEIKEIPTRGLSQDRVFVNQTL